MTIDTQIARLRPGARTGDPETSHEAAESVRKSASFTAQCISVLDLVRAYPGLSSKDLSVTFEALEMGLSRHAIARRLPDLRELQMVENRLDPETGRPRRYNTGIRWWPTNRGLRLSGSVGDGNA